MLTIQLTSSYFCAVVESQDSKSVSFAAPILHYMKGWSIEQVTSYASRKGWTTVQMES